MVSMVVVVILEIFYVVNSDSHLYALVMERHHMNLSTFQYHSQV